MNIQEHINSIKSRSFFSLLSLSEFDALIPHCTVETYQSGEFIKNDSDCPDLYLVVQGMVSLQDPRSPTNNLVGSVNPGRSLELSSFLHTPQRWKYRWVCSMPCVMLRISGPALRHLLLDNSVLSEYLNRIVGTPVLRRLKNDLKLFGFSPSEIQKLINSMELIPLTQTDRWQGIASLMGIHSGEISFSRKFEQGSRLLGRFLAGDYFYYHPDLEFETKWDDTADVWFLSEIELRNSADQKLIQSFLKIIDLIGDKVTYYQSLETPTGSDIGDSDTKTIEGEDDIPIDEFRSSADVMPAGSKNKPVVVLQHDEMDCGAACMATVARFYKKKINLSHFRSLIHVTRDGASMLAIRKAAQKVGFDAICVMSGYKGLMGLKAPFIALMRYHYLVVYHISEKSVLVGDPSRGLVTLSADEFREEFSKNVLLLKPNKKFDQYPESAPSFKKYLPFLKEVLPLLADIFIGSFLIFLFGLSTPLFMQFVFDNILLGKNISALNGLALAVIGISLLAEITKWIRGYLMLNLSTRIDAKFSSLFLRHVLRLPLNFFVVRRVGDITTRFQEIARIRSFFTGDTIGLLLSLISAILYGFVLFIYSWKMIFLLVLLLPFMGIYIRKVTPIMVANSRQMFKATARHQSLTFEQMSSVETIKSINGFVSARWRWENMMEKLFKSQRQFGLYASITQSAGGMLNQLISLFSLCLSIWLYTRHELTLGQVMSIQLIVGNVVGPVVQLIGQWENINQIKVSLERVDDIVTSAPEIFLTHQQDQIHPIEGRIEFKNVYFQYGSELSPMVLKNISFVIEPGQTVAFVGRSGSGKSTIAYLINRLYSPTTGKILIDQVDSAEIPLNSLRSQISMIIQENNIFSGTVLENIALGDENPSFKQVMEAAKSADAHDFISGLSEGYSYTLGDQGAGLSGGQKQRINIARALYKKPAILVLDEATSALDAMSEAVIVQNLKSHQNKRTTIVIAHRLNTVRSADKIFVVDKGQIVESGSHTELVLRQGLYYQLFRKQMFA